MKIVRTKKGELEAIKNARQAPESKPRRVSRSRLSSHKKHYSSEVIYTTITNSIKLIKYQFSMDGNKNNTFSSISNL